MCVNFNIEDVEVKRIHSDWSWSTTPEWLPLPTLTESIRSHGLLTPIRLLQTQAGLEVAAGFRRLRCVRELGLNRIPALITESSTRRETFLQSLSENLATRDFLDIEKAAAVQILDRLEILPERIIEEFLPQLGLRPDRFHLLRYRSLADLPPSLQQATLSGLDLEAAFQIRGWSESEQVFLIDLLKHWSVGRNKQRQLVELCDDLRQLRSQKVFELWEQAGASMPSELAGHPEAFDQIRSCLSLLRYPSLSAHQDRFQRLKQALALPEGVHLTVPRYFEGDQVTVHLRARTPAQLQALSHSIERLACQPEMEELFGLL